MKTIHFFTDKDGKLQMTVGEMEPKMPSQQVSVPHYTRDNLSWVRKVQVSNEFVFILRYGCPPVGIHLDDLIRLAVSVEPKISWPPIFTKQPHKEATGISATATGELDSVSYQWQSSEDGKEWSDIEGQRGTGIDVKGLKMIRCVASNEAGSTISQTINCDGPAANNQ